MSRFAWPDADLDPLRGRAGVYIFRDGDERVLYIGKSRDLKSRLTTYRTPGGDGRLGVRFLERDARSVETILTRTEAEALLLEDALIKEHSPPHNVRLKDDKSFLMVRVDDERFPRLKLVRAHNPKAGKKRGRSRFFGPFASARAVRRTLADLHRVVPLRDCTDSVLNNRTRPCLKHQLGLCSAPCVGLIEESAYAELVERAVRVLAGDTAELEADLEARMAAASAEREYELAAVWRDRLAALRRTVEGQGVRPRSRLERDVVGLARSGGDALVHRLAFRGGRLAESRSHLFRSELPDDELLHVVLSALFRTGRRDVPAEILVPCAPTEQELLEVALGGRVRIAVPRGGEGRRMLELAGENARGELLRLGAKHEAGAQAAAGLARLVDLGEERERLVVDCFDISNFQGSNVVASRVRFRAGVPDRAGYRRFRVRGVEGQDDFAAMWEVVGRSLTRGVREGDLPDLVVIDGGPAQLAKALEARDDAGAFDVRVVSLAKARAERRVKGRRVGAREERLFLSPEAEALELPRHSDVRHLLERIRDEAHRFAITYHRKERGRIRSRLDSIPGVGPAKRRELLRRFGSVVGVARASVEELEATPGISPGLARTIRDHLRDRPD